MLIFLLKVVLGKDPTEAEKEGVSLVGRTTAPGHCLGALMDIVGVQ